MIHVVLSWPSKELSPNSRAHWRKVASAKKAARTEAHFEALIAMNGCSPFDGPVKAKLLFHPPDARRRDLDNCFASMKAAIDGIADLIEIDDSKWEFEIAMGKLAPPLGCVEVEISAT